MARRAVWLVFFVWCLVVWCFGVSSATAQSTSPETVSSGSIGLRSGIDTNPTDTLGAHGSAFVTETVNYDYLRGSAGEGLAVKLSLSNTDYDPNVAAASTTALAAVTGTLVIAPDLNLRSTLTTTVDDNWARRSHAVQWRNRIEYDTSQIRLFANLDAGVNALNERNYFHRERIPAVRRELRDGHGHARLCLQVRRRRSRHVGRAVTRRLFCDRHFWSGPQPHRHPAECLLQGKGGRRRTRRVVVALSRGVRHDRFRSCPAIALHGESQICDGRLDVRCRVVADHPGYHAVVCIPRFSFGARGLHQLQARRR